MHTNKRYYKIFDCCKVVTGYSRCMIYDLQRHRYFAVPLYLNTLLDKINKHEIGSAEFTEKDLEWLAYLTDKEIVFTADENLKELFTASDNTFYYPAHVSNAVITLNQKPAFSLNLLKSRLEEAMCRDIVIVFNHYVPDTGFITEICEALEGSLLKTVDLFIPFTSHHIITEYEKITDRYNRLSNIFIYNAPHNSVYKSSEIELGNIILQVSDIIDTQTISVVSTDHFSLNGDLYRESLQYNTFYNKKVFINETGNVYNTQAMQQPYGNIITTELKDIIAIKGFDELWHVKKEDIEVCCDCEYRHMCVDARTPVKNESGAWAFKSSCNYNPYNTTWQSNNVMAIEGK